MHALLLCAEGDKGVCMLIWVKYLSHETGGDGLPSRERDLPGHEYPRDNSIDNSPQASPAVDAARLRLVLEITNTVRESWSSVPPEMVAATILAKYHRNMNDIVQHANGIYLSRECWAWISSLEVWVSEEGEIFVTQKIPPGRQNLAPGDTVDRLKRMLPKSKSHGGIPSMAYVTALAFEVGFHPRRILTDRETCEPRVSDIRNCAICGKTVDEFPAFLVQKNTAGRFIIRDFCCEDCRKLWVEEIISSHICTWCGENLSSKSYCKGDFGEIYCSGDCALTAASEMLAIRGKKGDISPSTTVQ